MLGKILSIVLTLLLIGFTVWLVTAFAGLAIAGKIISAVFWIALVVGAIWLIRKAFATAA